MSQIPAVGAWIEHVLHNSFIFEEPGEVVEDREEDDDEDVETTIQQTSL